MSQRKSGAGAPPTRPPIRTNPPDLSPLVSIRLRAIDAIPPDEPYPDPEPDGDGGQEPPVVSTATDPADWPDWTDAERWFLDAEDLDESDPELPLFLLRPPTFEEGN